MQNHTRFVTAAASLLQQYEAIPGNARGLLATRCHATHIEPALADAFGGSVTRQVIEADDVERNDVERLRRCEALGRTSRA
ncbi:MAG TPA: hypothetical protein VN612_10255, partial [Acidobacteriaceae bacterium]|nr:hypothetical protein [Acidobacteriaceae bacterium]